MPLPATPLTPRFFAHTPSRIEACVAGRRRRRSFTRRVTRAAGTARSASLATDRRRRCGAGVRRVRPHRRPGGTAVAPVRADRFMVALAVLSVTQPARAHLARLLGCPVTA